MFVSLTSTLQSKFLAEFSIKTQNLRSPNEVFANLESTLKTICPSIRQLRAWLLQISQACPLCSLDNPLSNKSETALHLSYPINEKKYHYVPINGTKLGNWTLKKESFLLRKHEFNPHEFGFQIENASNLVGQVLDVHGNASGYIMIMGDDLNEDDCSHLNILSKISMSAIHTLFVEQEIKLLKQRLYIENSLLKEEIQKQHDFGFIIGHSSELKKVLEKVEMVAPTDASVLITGQSGTGKELIARAIHEKSQRSDKPLIKVNCASIPRELFESEFFGHVKGAFTGAHRNREGRFHMANGGTLFLDEVGEIPLELQSKLLRVLQEDQFEMVGDDQTQTVDVRIIAATNQNLVNHPNNFRQDLYYRLSVFPIQCPSLQERCEDIPLLAQHFVEQACKHFNKPSIMLTKQQIQELKNHDWPGNIRELKNLTERAVIASKNGLCTFEIPSSITSKNFQSNAILTQTEIQELEKNNIVNALTKTRGKISGIGGAAELLGMMPSTLASRLAKLGLKKEDLLF